ncbi:MAG: HipA domain-containing protein [Bacteroidetes bacterium]|nr:HipA domain-containing protein [Bacteroidota bacterium]
MSICPITYLETDEKYSPSGLKLLSRKIKSLNDLSYSREELLHEAKTRAAKLSIQGVQPKLSAKFSVTSESFELVDRGGRFIVKPQNDLFPELPENEDLTMRLAEVIKLQIPFHGLIYGKDSSLSYFIKRFDRTIKNKKLAVEDFAQLSGASRETKYNSSMEKVVKIIDSFCSFPVVEKAKIFKLTVFNFLIGNEDMHLKNFSIIRQNGLVKLSPFYDLVSTTIALKNPLEEIALPIRGKKNKLNREDLVGYFGTEVLGLNEKVINQSLDLILTSRKSWEILISKSFLSSEMKNKYHSLLNERIDRLFLNKTDL